MFKGNESINKKYQNREPKGQKIIQHTCILDFLFWRRCAPRSWEILCPFPLRGRMFAPKFWEVLCPPTTSPLENLFEEVCPKVSEGIVSPYPIPIEGLSGGCYP